MGKRSYAQKRESKALAAVETYERKHGRRPEPSKQGTGFDIKSGPRRIEVKTIKRVQNGFVQLGARQFQVLCEDKNYWIYLVVLDPRPQVFPLRRREILARIRPYVHFDYFYRKQELLRMR